MQQNNNSHLSNLSQQSKISNNNNTNPFQQNQPQSDLYLENSKQLNKVISLNYDGEENNYNSKASLKSNDRKTSMSIKNSKNSNDINNNSNLINNQNKIQINQSNSNYPQTNNPKNQDFLSNLSNNFSNGKNPTKEEQEKIDTYKKTQIIYNHTVVQTNIYDYTPGEKESIINQLLEEMSIYGEITKKEIEKQKLVNPHQYMSIEEAFAKGKEKNNFGFRNQYFILSILAKALMSQGCTVVIEKDLPKYVDKNNEIYTTVQFLVNGMYNFKKYIFHFDFGEEKNYELLKDLKIQKHFNMKLKKKLLYLFGLKENDIIMSDPRLGSYTITSIIKKEKFNELTKEQLFQELLKDKEFERIKEIEHSILLSGCKLNPHMLDSVGNNKDGGWGINEKRGGLPYSPPLGWDGYGLRVLNRFDKGDNKWLGHKNEKGEWSVAYHGMGNAVGGSQIMGRSNNFGFNNLNSGIKKQFEYSNDINHQGEKVGEGIYVTPNPKVMEQFCGTYKCGDKNYKIGFMTRVYPQKMRIPAENQDYWVINGTDNEIRPYRILIKEA